MTGTADDILQRLYATQAIAIWDSAKGPVFWYTANVPGPFFVNTEWVIGRELAGALLKQTDAILATQTDPAARAAALKTLFLDAWKGSADYQAVIAALVATARERFAQGAFRFVSGGERRDWIFSFPFAGAMGVPHLTLFKEGTAHPEQAPQPGDAALHIADLLNNAASYFELWLPALEKLGVACPATLCVTSRGDTGLNRLKEAGKRVESLAHIGLPLFAAARESGMIAATTYEELATHFRSAPEWAETYLMERPALFNVAGVGAKDFERLAAFFTKDPWGLATRHPEVFASVRAAIATRREKEEGKESPKACCGH